MLSVRPVFTKRSRSHPRKRIFIDNHRVKKMFRAAKSEIAAELLFTLWDNDDYDIEKLIYPLWSKKVIPLIELGLDIDRAHDDMYRFVESL